MKKILLFTIFILFISAAFLYAQTAENMINNSGGILVDLQQKFATSLNRWIDKMKKYAINLFWFLAIINLSVKMIMLLIEGTDLTKTTATLTKYVFVTGIFYYFLEYGVELAQDIINSFIQMGNEANGSGTKINIEAILNLGWDLVQSTVKGISFGEIPSALAKLIIGLITFIILLLILGSYIVELFSAWLLVYMGYFVLAFGGSDWTREAAIAYIKAILATGMRLLTIMFMIALAIDLIRSKIIISANMSDSAMIYCLTVAFLLLLLIQKLPDAVSALISSAWGHMSGINMATAMTSIAMTASAGKVAYSFSKGAGSRGQSFVHGVSDYLQAQKLAGGSSIPNNASENNTNSVQSQKEQDKRQKIEKNIQKHQEQAKSSRTNSAAYAVGKGTGYLLSKMFNNKASESPFNKSNDMSKKTNAGDKKDEKRSQS